MAKTVLSKEIIAEIKKKLDAMEGKEVDAGSLISVSGELPDDQLGSVAGGVSRVAAAWSVNYTTSRAQ